jgi:hypothetical protein
MDDTTLAGIEFSHRDCLWCRVVPEDRRAEDGCRIARLLAEVERLREEREEIRNAIRWRGGNGNREYAETPSAQRVLAILDREA